MMTEVVANAQGPVSTDCVEEVGRVAGGGAAVSTA
jgi:hypothetical protein